MTEFMAWGYPIPGRIFQCVILQNKKVDFILNNLYGHYYFILMDYHSGRLTVGNSYFSILPIYYHETEETVYLSDNAIRLGKYCGKTNLSRRFVLETTLFNYPLFNHSAIEGVSLLSSNSFFSFSGGKPEVIRHTHTDQSFVAFLQTGVMQSRRQQIIFSPLQKNTFRKSIILTHSQEDLTEGPWLLRRFPWAAGLLHSALERLLPVTYRWPKLPPGLLKFRLLA